MAAPLISLGPGGDHNVNYHIRGRSLVKSSGSALGHHAEGESAGGNAMWGKFSGRGKQKQQKQAAAAAKRQADVFEHTGANAAGGIYQPGNTMANNTSAVTVEAKASAAVFTAIESWITAQRIALTQLGKCVGELQLTLDDTPVLALHDPSATEQNDGPFKLEMKDEPDPQTTTHSYTYPRLSAVPRLFPDDAGIGRRTGGQQGYRLRARRGINQKRRVSAASQQGTLFGT